MNCKICNSKSEKKNEAPILKKYTVSLFQCPKCFFVQTENPYWLPEAYKNPINTQDTGLMQRNLNTVELTSIILYLYFKNTGIFLDYAGGYGIFTRLMRDVGYNFYWHDLYTPNLLARGFEFVPNKSNKVDLITSFESFEHFDDPLKEIEKMLCISKNIFFSTMLIPTPLPSPDVWNYYGFNHGQHISFYSRKSLEYVAKKYGLYFYTNNKNLHIFSKQRLPFFNFSLIYKLRRFGFMRLIKHRTKSKTVSDQLLFE